MPKTQREIEDLKHSWSLDPIWAIEETEGFEEHREELAAYSQHMKERWEQRWQDTLIAKAAEIGCDGNLTLAAYVLRLERRLDDLEARQA